MRALADYARSRLHRPAPRTIDEIPEIVEQLGRRLGADRAYVLRYLREPSQGAIRGLTIALWPDSIAGRSRFRPFDSPPLDEMLSTMLAENVLVVSRDTAPPTWASYLLEAQVASFIWVPIVSDGAVWGHIGTSRLTGCRAWSEADIGDIQAIGRLIGSILDGEEDLSTRNRRDNVLAAIVEAGQERLQGRPLLEVMQNLVERILVALDAVRASVILASEDDVKCYLAVASRPDAQLPDSVAGGPVWLPSSDITWLFSELKDGRPVTTCARDPGAGGPAPGESIANIEITSTPIVVAGRLWGILGLSRDRANVIRSGALHNALEVAAHFLGVCVEEAAAAEEQGRHDTVLREMSRLAGRLMLSTGGTSDVGVAVGDLQQALGYLSITVFQTITGPDGTVYSNLEIDTGRLFANGGRLPRAIKVEPHFSEHHAALESGAVVRGTSESVSPAQAEAVGRVRTGDHAWVAVPWRIGVEARGHVSFITDRAMIISDREVDALCTVAHLIGVALHRHELKSMIDALRRRDMIGRLAGGVAHEINNSLLVVRLSAAALARSEQSDTAAKAQRILVAAEGSSGLVQQLIALRDGEWEDAECFALAESLGRLEPILGALAGDGSTVTVTCSEGIFISAARNVFEKCVIELVSNACDAIGKQGRVWVEGNADIERHAALITVNDTGPGIPLEGRDLVVDPFYSTKPGAASTGLGLTTVDAFVRRHDGVLLIGERPGGGAAVSIRLPLATPPEPNGGRKQGISRPL